MTDTLVSIQWSDTAATERRNAEHVQLARRFWAGREVHDVITALPAPQPAPGGYSGDAAIQDAPAGFASSRDAGIPVGSNGTALAGFAPVGTPPVPLVQTAEMGIGGYIVVMHREGAWGPAWWLVYSVSARKEVARYCTADCDGDGAILRYLQERQYK